MDYKNQIFNMDCLAGLSLLPDNSVDMVLTDLPYGTTSGAWDTLLPLPDLWRQLNRVTKRNGAMVFYGRAAVYDDADRQQSQAVPLLLVLDQKPGDRLSVLTLSAPALCGRDRSLLPCGAHL